MKTTVMAAVMLCALDLSALDAFSVTQEFLDHECRKTDIRVVGNEAAIGARPSRMIIGYTCSDTAETVEYEALHFLCPHRGPKVIAAAVYDVQEQRYLTDLENDGNYHSVVKLDDIPTPACDLPL